MKTADFDFDLPEHLIAQTPIARRDASRLLVLPRAAGAPVHAAFRDLCDWLRPGDLLVLNDAKVIPARLKGAKEGSGGRVELLLCDPLAPAGGKAVWRCMAGSSKPLRVGGGIRFGDGDESLRAEVVAIGGEGFVDVAFDEAPDALLSRVEGIGELPLPPYMRREANEIDRERYQTIYARVPGAVAAPTAGLHFTDEVFASLRDRGVERATVTLHVGPGTFLPVRADDVASHRMHAERYFVSPETVDAVARTRARGGRVIAVGTTALRTLESAALAGRSGALPHSTIEPGGAPRAAASLAATSAAAPSLAATSAADGEPHSLRPGAGVSELFVKPGFELRVVDGLLTNFHLPRSTLVMLVAALAGRERLLAAYAEAVEREYRFYSYGDAMLVI